jgi:hypothetical protein
MWKRKRVGNVSNSHTIALDEYSNDVESIGVGRTSVPIDPNGGRASQLSLFAPVYGFDRIPKLRPAPSLHLDERDGACSLHDEIDVAMAAPESALNDPISLPLEPSLRDPLPQFAKRLPGR